MKCLLKGGTVVSGQGSKKLDLIMENGLIQAMDENISTESLVDTEVIDVSGKLLFPGFIDAHTHFDLPVSGTVTADGFETGTKAAISGGTTMVIDYATQYKGESLEEGLENWNKKAAGKSSCDYGFHMAVSDWNEKTCHDLQVMIDKGVSTFKLYMTYDEMYLNDKYIYQVLKRLKEVGGLVGVHCENKGLIEALVSEEQGKGHLGVDAHPRTRPDLIEAEAVARLLKIAKLADTPVMVVHLSSAAGYQEICHAREEGQQVFVETCPQYLVMDETCYTTNGFEAAKYAISPPLRKKDSQETLWKALAKNQIQTIATDHCSFTLAQKAAGKSDFTKIPCGMPGVENRAVIMYTYGVKEKKITVEQMCQLLSENVAKLYGLYPQKGALKVGSDADLVVWDPSTDWTISVKNQVSVCDYSPYEGVNASGRAELVFLRGELVAKEGQVLKEHQGKFVERKTWSPCEA